MTTTPRPRSAATCSRPPMCARKPISTAASPAFSARSRASIFRNTATSPTRSRGSRPRTTRTASAIPIAQMRKDLGYEFCRRESEKNPLVAGPLKRTDCSPVSDGAAALVLADEDTARSSARRSCSAPPPMCRISCRWRSATSQVRGLRAGLAARARGGGRCADDLSLVETHDCFTIAELIEYEAMGLVPEGRGARAIKDGLTAMGGRCRSILRRAQGQRPSDRRHRRVDACAGGHAAHRHGGRLPGEGRAAGGIFNMGGTAVANYVSILERIR